MEFGGIRNAAGRQYGRTGSADLVLPLDNIAPGLIALTMVASTANLLVAGYGRIFVK
jgi:hypothetical protein